jgi:hypothetical protein
MTMAGRQKVSEQIEAINLLELEMKAREFLPQTAYDYYASGANAPGKLLSGLQAIACSFAGRFRTARWSVVLLSAQIAAEGRLGP